MNVVTISEAPLRIDELLDVARGARVELAPDARSQVLAGRAVVDDALTTGEPIYGLNTGVGHKKDIRLSEAEVRTQQETLVMTHAGGLGDSLPTEVVRAAILVRLNGIARGGSGASLAAADVLAAMLNAGVHPVIPNTGSVGAGDLGQMAGIAMVAIGRGTAEFDGERLSGAEALRRARIEPLALGPRDGLALISANGISIGHAALVIARLERGAAMADVALGLSLEATAGNPSIALPVIGAAKPYPGQIDAGEGIRAALSGSYLFEAGAAHSVQDALSFRVTPQVHGAVREMITFARRSIEIELNSISDNPLVSLRDKALVHNGNFHPVVLAVAFDTLRIVLAHAGQLVERRMSHLWDAIFENLAGAEEGVARVSAPASYGLSLRYPAAALLSELKQLAAPATLDCPPLDVGTEDHATSAPLSVRKTESSVALLEDLLVIELLLARDVLATMSKVPSLGKATGEALRTVEETVAQTSSPDAAHRELRSRLFPSSAEQA
jgi:histidine ammonia-lyase